MIRHLFVAALRNMVANRLQSAIAVLGLSLGIAGAIIAGLGIQYQTHFDDYLPNSGRIYWLTAEITESGRPTDYVRSTSHDLAAKLKLTFRDIEAVARFKTSDHALRHGNVEARELVNAADPDVFRILRFPVLHGALDQALVRPDSIVIPESIARKYFGRDDVVGETLEMDRSHPLTVTAVIADLATNGSNFSTTIFTSGTAAYSDLAGANQMPDGLTGLNLTTLVLRAPGASELSLQNEVEAASQNLLPHPPGMSATLHLIRLDALHLSPDYSPGVRDITAVFVIVALLVLFLSGVNFVNLVTARAARRGIEVGVRKGAGAGQAALVAQFLGEALLQTLIALCIALALVEQGLPAVNAFLNGGLALDYWRDPLLILILLAGACGVGVAAGAYPAFFLAALRPVTVLKGPVADPKRASLVRQLLVTSQFAILILLVISTGVVLEQYQFAMHANQRLNTDLTLFVEVPKCGGAFQDQVAALPGVRGVACSDLNFLDEVNVSNVRRPGGTMVTVDRVTAGPGLLELYGQRPIAGRGLRAADMVSSSDQPTNAILNQAAISKLGFSSPQAALGHAIAVEGHEAPAIIVGVVANVSVYALEKNIAPSIYYFRGPNSPVDWLLHVKLDGSQVPQTLAAIDAAWDRSGASGPIQRQFMDAYIENLHLTLLREGQFILVFVGVALLLACLGLFGLSIHAAERRTKEIGVRKALGGSNREIIGLLLWQFLRPVMVANLVAWPLAWWAMNRWLSGFAYHVPLSWWLFPAAGAATLLIALATVAGQAFLVARQKPVLALRYE